MKLRGSVVDSSDGLNQAAHLVGVLFSEFLDQHPELCAPVADVVDAMDVVPLEFEDAGNGVADDRRPEVPDVHFLGQVRAGHIDDDDLRIRHPGNPQTIFLLLGGWNLSERCGEELVLQAEVDESRPGDCGRLAKVVDLEAGDNLLCQLAWLAAELLGESHGAVRLIVAALRVLRRRHQRVRLRALGAEHSDQRFGNSFNYDSANALHHNAIRPLRHEDTKSNSSRLECLVFAELRIRLADGGLGRGA